MSAGQTGRYTFRRHSRMLNAECRRFTGELQVENLSFLKALILGVIQGLTEFLPVSSSGHIMLGSEIFQTELEGGLLSSFTVLLHAGTLLVACIVYFDRIIKMLRHPIKSELKWLIAATLPTVIYALILKFTGWDEVIDATARTMLPFSFLLTSIFLLIADGFAKNRRIAKKARGKVKGKNALAMGLMQCVGTFTGVSRSGSTITGGLASGLTPSAAVDFAFLMSVPATLGAIVLDVYEGLKGDMDFSALTDFVPQITVGVLASFVAGLLALKLMVLAAKKGRLKIFAAYMFLLSVLVMINDFAGAIWLKV